MWMRGGTSKGGYFLASDLPEDLAARDAALLSIMGSPDPRQIDGMGGADPLTSKAAVVEPSERPGVDVKYLFLQVYVDQPIVTDAQNCGNILAGVAPFAIERLEVCRPIPGKHGSTACRDTPRRSRSPSGTRSGPAAAPCCLRATSLTWSTVSR